ncbi:metal ABC transporter permease [Nesterenkonia sp. LB17]|uniref:metal ABC transporter permease n=2 Tax=unclassified Nesterenkonia TaxID=2629769 RepID=UPI001F4C9B7C|nr:MULTISPECIES: metal ABC transporter permease [unclassified Nesterenkonia]MCH8561728.1 metal ABC transporter permease [Nesterenkonia sp. YGD6]MCH8564753.1 metal ABC transporter permease [Nesterenkonia sp. LB17]MCH8570373.1 metal ABC transporter permease [Nesterenkonia sp. AY15]
MMETLTGSFTTEGYWELFSLVRNSVITAGVLGLMGGLIGVFIMLRRTALVVHGIAEISFAGAALALLIGVDVVAGSALGAVAASVLIGVLSLKDRDTSAVTGVLMPFGLGLGILFLSLYQGRSANKFGLLTGQIVGVDDIQTQTLVTGAVVISIVLLLIWRPLMFASVDPQLARARGVRVNLLSMVFMVLLGVAVAMSVQVVGALLVLALLVVPAAAALKVTVRPYLAVLLSMLFALISSVGGIMLAITGTVPISPYITTISFMIYVVCVLVGRGGRNRRRQAAAVLTGWPLTA